MHSDTKFSWNVEIKEYAHPTGDMNKNKGDENDVGDGDGKTNSMNATFFLAMAMFGFVFQISSLVTEKELKLRQVFNWIFP